MSEEEKRHKGEKKVDCGCGCIGTTEKKAEQVKQEVKKQTP